MRVFLDANILFSAAKTDGAIKRLVEFLLEAGHECWADGYVVEEARRNLTAKAVGRIDELTRLLERITVAAVVRDVELEALLPLPEKDRPVLAAAIRSGCAALVSGDRTHFGDLYGKTLHGVKIHSPQSVAAALGVAERITPYRVKKVRRRQP